MGQEYLPTEVVAGARICETQRNTYMHVRPSLERTLPVLLDHLVGPSEQRRRHGEAESLGGFEIDYQFMLGRRLHW